MTQPIPIKLYPRLTRGRFNTIRVALVILTQLVFLGLPWLQWNQRQAVLFDLERHRFFIFGASFWPQDLVYLAALLVVCALALFWSTTLAGRLWCGYSCPQTVYTQIMLWIERLLLGDHKARRKLDAAPLSAGKLLRLGSAHGLMLLFALWTGFSLVAYFTPARELASSLRQGQTGPWETFWLLFYAGFTYLLAARLREKVCSHMCPYARFQGAMFDRDTLIISYDARRGEPRGKQADKTSGGCIDCGICVQVCPTGIDIRNGLQYECIGCAACIDACDQVMDQLQAPRGLIRYTSAAALEGKAHGKPAWRRPRVLYYSGLLLGISTLALLSYLNRLPFKADILRDRATLVRETDEGWLENSYSVRLINSSEVPQRLLIDVEGLPGIRLASAAQPVTLAATATETIGLRVQLAPQYAARGANDIHFIIRSLDQPGQLLREKSSFIGE